MNLSSGGLLVRLEGIVVADCVIELTVAWPARLTDGRSLCLRISGRILRANGALAAIELLDYGSVLVQSRVATFPSF